MLLVFFTIYTIPCVCLVNVVHELNYHELNYFKRIPRTYEYKSCMHLCVMSDSQCIWYKGMKRFFLGKLYNIWCIHVNDIHINTIYENSVCVYIMQVLCMFGVVGRGICYGYLCDVLRLVMSVYRINSCSDIVSEHCISIQIAYVLKYWVCTLCI